MTRLAERPVGTAAAFLYRFAWKVPDALLDAPNQALGSIHALELPFVFGNFTDWDMVAPEFRDSLGDPVHRDHRGWGAGVQYTNHTGRNDLRRAKISWDPQFFHFYVQANAPITPATDAHWMMLYIDSDADAATGWMGYDWVVNRFRDRSGHCSIEKNVGNGYRWEQVGDGSVAVAGSERMSGWSVDGASGRVTSPIPSLMTFASGFAC